MIRHYASHKNMKGLEDLLRFLVRHHTQKHLSLSSSLLAAIVIAMKSVGFVNPVLVAYHTLDDGLPCLRSCPNLSVS